MRYVVPETTASLLSTERVSPAAVYITNGARAMPPGPKVILGSPTPSGPTETVVPSTMMVVA